MKKKILIILCLMTLVLAGCKREDGADNKASDGSPTDALTVTLTKEPTPTPMVVDTFSIQDYYPVEADTKYQYDGEGNEFAAYTRYIEFIDKNTEEFRRGHKPEVRIRYVCWSLRTERCL
jgi:hypothetical protein